MKQIIKFLLLILATASISLQAKVGDTVRINGYLEEIETTKSNEKELIITSITDDGEEEYFIIKNNKISKELSNMLDYNVIISAKIIEEGDETVIEVTKFEHEDEDSSEVYPEDE